MKSLKLCFEQQTVIFLSGTTIKQILVWRTGHIYIPSFDIIIMPKMLQ